MGRGLPNKKGDSPGSTKKLLEEILPQFGFPAQVGSDHGPAFVSKVSQGLAAVLGTNWKLHCAYRPQSSGQVERMNRTLRDLGQINPRDWRGLGGAPPLCLVPGAELTLHVAVNPL